MVCVLLQPGLTHMGKTIAKTNKESLSACEKDSENLWMTNLPVLFQSGHSLLLQLL